MRASCWKTGRKGQSGAVPEFFVRTGSVLLTGWVEAVKLAAQAVQRGTATFTKGRFTP